MHMRLARKEHALLAPLLGAAPGKGVTYFGAELMVRIHPRPDNPIRDIQGDDAKLSHG